MNNIFESIKLIKLRNIIIIVVILALIIKLNELIY